MESAPEFFAARIHSYDSLIRRIVPGYEAWARRLIDLLPAAAADVVELGCGTGFLSLALAARYPAARITFVDASEEMVELTRARITAAAPATAERARFLAARFEDMTLQDRGADLITSSLSLHHVQDKLALFTKLHDALRSGGRLCFADQVRAAPEALHQRNWDEWIAFCRAPGNCTEEETAFVIEHSHTHDHYVTPAAQLELLARAGFVEPDCLWRDGMWAILGATAR
jgi:ubiquinone/menaquinone biosynthesis C-methylase UbiE